MSSVRRSGSVSSVLFASLLFWAMGYDAACAAYSGPYPKLFFECDGQANPPVTDDERIRACEYLVGLGPKGFLPFVFGAIYKHLGELYGKAGKYELALKNDQSALIYFRAAGKNALPDSEFNIFFQIGIDYFNLGLFEESLASIQSAKDTEEGKSLRVAQVDWGLGVLKGDVEFAQGNYQDAVNDYENERKVYKDFPGLALKIARAKRALVSPPPPPDSKQNPSPPAEPIEACKMFANLC